MPLVNLDIRKGEREMFDPKTYISDFSAYTCRYIIVVSFFFFEGRSVRYLIKLIIWKIDTKTL